MNEKQKGLIIVLSGPSGTGKSTVIHKLLDRRNDIAFSVSATTRSPRSGETDGVDYYFKTREQFQKLIDDDGFLEHAEFTGNCYGTLAAPVEAQCTQGFNVLLDIEVQGAAQVMACRPDAVTIFLAPPSMEILEQRLRGRATDSEETIVKRLQTAVGELRRIPAYQYLIINEDADLAAAQLDAVINAELCRTSRRNETVRALLGDNNS